MTADEGEPVDHFGVVSEKLGFLLNVEARDRALLVGPRPAAWRRDAERYFAGCDWLPSTRELSIGEPYRLVVWDPSLEQPSGLVAAAAILARAAGAQGRLLVLGRNAWPPALFRRTRQTGAVESRWSLGAYRRALTDAGFRGVRSFLAMPNMSSWEEAVATEGEPADSLPRSHWALRVSGLAGSPRLHDGFVLTAGREGSPLTELEGRLIAALGSEVAGEGVTITRFSLRSRGALVLTLRGPGAGPALIVRAAVTAEVDRRVSVNAQRVRELLAEPRVPDAIRRRLPQPVGATVMGDQRIYAERRIEGVLAWQLPKESGARLRADADALEFVNDLARATLVIDPADTLFGQSLESGLRSDIAAAPPAVQTLVRDLADRIRGRLPRSGLPLVFSHGDYGYGNLITGRDGGLRGVIDWDCSHPRELWGVDWCNFLIQKWRTDHVVPVAESIRAVASQLDQVAASLWIEGPAVPATSVLVETAFLLAGLRYVTRAARYPDEFAQGLEDFHDTLGRLLQMAG